MDASTRPEIQRTSLTSVVLTLMCLGIHDILGFPLLDPPDEGQLVEALRQLFFYDTIDTECRVTEIGRNIHGVPARVAVPRAHPHRRCRVCARGRPDCRCGHALCRGHLHLDRKLGARGRCRGCQARARPRGRGRLQHTAARVPSWSCTRGTAPVVQRELPTLSRNHKCV